PGFGFNAGIIRGGPRITGRILEQPNCGQRWEFLPLSMSGFADALTMFVGKPVVDETSLKGDYLFTLDINADNMHGRNRTCLRATPPPAPGGRWRRATRWTRRSGAGTRASGPGSRSRTMHTSGNRTSCGNGWEYQHAVKSRTEARTEAAARPRS